MNNDVIKEFISYISSNSEQIVKMIKCMEKDKPGSTSYQTAMQYIKDLCNRSNEFAEFLNNLLK